MDTGILKAASCFIKIQSKERCVSATLGGGFRIHCQCVVKYLFILNHIFVFPVNFTRTPLFSVKCGNQCSLEAGHRSVGTFKSLRCSAFSQTMKEANPQLELTSPSFQNCIPPVMPGYVTHVLADGFKGKLISIFQPGLCFPSICV